MTIITTIAKHSTLRRGGAGRVFLQQHEQHCNFRGGISNLISNTTTTTYFPSSSKCGLLHYQQNSQVVRYYHHHNVAIVGSGPSGCYTAKYLMMALDKQKPNDTYTVHMLERLPTPYGLVRFGVAPDHPEVKNVQHDFDALFDAGDDAKMEFFGNVHVGDSVSLEELRRMYDVVVLAYGCESDKKLPQQKEGSDDKIQGILSAREFVAWYNGHPEFKHIGDEVKQALSGSKDGAEIVIIGVGNVALDCGRILVKGRDGLNDTDIASHALDVFDDAKISKVTIVGRRGHVQAAFTIKELRELTKLDIVKFHVHDEELSLGSNEASMEELKKGRPKQRIDKLLREAATKGNDGDSDRELHLRFLLNPQQFETNDDGAVSSVVCERTQLEGDAGKQKAVGTGETMAMPAQLVLVSIGYKGLALPGLEDSFDHNSGILPNDNGRVIMKNENDENDNNNELANVYVSGWLKRGPSGIIGTNIPDAKDTVQTIVHDLLNDDNKNENNNIDTDVKEQLTNLLESRNVQIVTWSNYQNIVAAEDEEAWKRSKEQPREKITNIPDLLKAAATNK